MDRRFRTVIVSAAVFMTALLFIDRDGLLNQLLLGGATAAFLWWCARQTRIETRQIICCIIVATTGEVVLSLGWGLYSYHHALIPLYVPPGHGLFYLLAATSAQQPLLRRYEKPITRSVLMIGTAIAISSLVFRHDTWGFLWWAGALLLIRFSQNQLLLATCFVYTNILEWVGTAIGNWRWTAEVPFVGLHSANPPAGVGILYILLDLIVVAITTAMSRPRVEDPTIIYDVP